MKYAAFLVTVLVCQQASAQQSIIYNGPYGYGAFYDYGTFGIGTGDLSGVVMSRIGNSTFISDYRQYQQPFYGPAYDSSYSAMYSYPAYWSYYTPAYVPVVPQSKIVRRNQADVGVPRRGGRPFRAANIR